MVSLSQIQNGAVNYIDNEILAKLGGWQKWAFGALSAIWLSNIAGIFNNLKQHPLVAYLGIVDDHDMIDIEKLYREFYKQAQKGAITFQIPAIGPVTLDQRDVEKLYQYIIGG